MLFLACFYHASDFIAQYLVHSVWFGICLQIPLIYLFPTGSQITCGAGIQRRHVLCKRDDGVEVEDAHCERDSTALVRRHRACLIDCPQDCQLGDWMEWTSCSTVCGPGLRQRYREPITPAANGGRPCPSLVENSTCTELECTDLEWYISEVRRQ